MSLIRVSEYKHGRTHQVANHGETVGCDTYEKRGLFGLVWGKKSKACMRLALCYPLECTAAADARWR